MKFLADENIGQTIIILLRKVGYDIKSVIEINPGLDDANVLSVANKENRILITTDKDFGELVFVSKLVHNGIILLRLKKDSAKNKLRVLRKLFIQHPKELRNNFTVVTETQIRIRKG